MVSQRSKKETKVGKLRNLVLGILVIAVVLYTALMFSVTQRLSEQLGPGVRADLEWRVQRGAREIANAADLGLVLGDEALVKQAFAAHSSSNDVMAIVAVNSKGKSVALHGQLPEATESLFRGAPHRLRSEKGYLVSWAPAELEGVAVGRVALVVSTTRLTEANALLMRASNATLFGGVTLLLVGTLVVGLFAGAVARRDAQLSEYAASLEHKVAERTQELDERNRGMRLVLDNVVQGFITVDLNGTMSSERSAICDLWFGAPEPGASLAEYLKPHAPEFANWFELNLTQLRDGSLPAEMVLGQMPTRFSTNGRTFDVAYSPIGSGQDVEQMLVIVSDVTEQIVLERAERDQKELVVMFQRILADRSGVEAFVREASRLVDALQTELDPAIQRRQIHTLKGSSAMFGLMSVSKLAHNVESSLVENDSPLDDTQRVALVETWQRAAQHIHGLLGESYGDNIEIQREELRSVVAKARAGMSGHRLAALLEDWEHDPAQKRLEELARQGAKLARALGKPEPKFEIQGHHVRLDAATWSSFWSAMAHAVRNSMDHGIEDAETRVAAGKGEAGSIKLSANRSAGRLTICLTDDGRGIDWELLRSKLRQAGLPHREHGDLVAGLLADGITTREQVTDISGRGVGLAALRQAVEELNGSITVESQAAHGTTFRFVFTDPPRPSTTPSSGYTHSSRVST